MDSKHKIILSLFVFCLVGTGVFYFFDSQEMQVRAIPDPGWNSY